jgi:uncharacterized protein YdbL (DUF1318 family)
MRRRLLFVPLTLLALAACVTINVYFPEAAIKDLSQEIERQVQKEAAEAPAAPPAAGPAPAETPPQDQRGPAAPDLLSTLLGATPVYAAGVPSPEIESPAIRKIIAARAQRVDALARFKAAGAVGESHQGLLEIRKLDAVADLKERAQLQKLVRDENQDREQLFKEIAAAKGVDLSQLPRIRETYAETLRNNAKPGEWIQLPGGEWKQK